MALGDERYGLELRHISGIRLLEQLTPLPCTPAFILGVLNVRGHIVAVADLKKFFGLPEKGIADLHHVVLAEADGVELALVADLVIGTRDVPLATLQPALPTLTGVRAEYFRGLTPDRLIVLDVRRILADPRLVVHDEPKS
jgi:purine-binding chemotaxis protein CheW